MRTSEIALRCGVSRKFIQRRAKKEQWPYAVQHSRGGHCHDFNFSELPDDIRARINSKEVIVDRVVGWFDRISRSQTVDRWVIYFLVFSIGYFMGYFVYRFQ